MQVCASQADQSTLPRHRNRPSIVRCTRIVCSWGPCAAKATRDDRPGHDAGRTTDLWRLFSLARLYVSIRVWVDSLPFGAVNLEKSPLTDIGIAECGPSSILNRNAA